MLMSNCTNADLGTSSNLKQRDMMCARSPLDIGKEGKLILNYGSLYYFGGML